MGQEMLASSSAILDARVWLERSPSRVAGGWSMVAALLAMGFPMSADRLAPPLFVLLFLLVDLLWGSIWGALVRPDSLPSVAQRLRQTRIWLPYLRIGSPAARLFGHDGPGILPLMARVMLPGVAVALAVSVVLEPMLFWMTVAVVLLSVGGWLHRQVAVVPVVLFHSLVAVTLPWWATLHVVGGLSSHTYYHIALVGLWTLHTWGSNRSVGDPAERAGLVGVALAQFGVSLLLILAQAPLWLAVLSVLWLPTWLAVYRGQSLQRVGIWWLLAMLVSSLALGQSLYSSL